MAKLTQIKTSFAAGELSPQALRRIDLPTYAQGAATLRNVLVSPSGGVRRRKGTVRIDSLIASPLGPSSRLVPYHYGNENGILVFNGTTCTLIKVNSGATPDTKVAEVSVAQLLPSGVSPNTVWPEMDYTQLGDTIVFVHQKFPPFKLLYEKGALSVSPINAVNKKVIRKLNSVATETLVTTSHATWMGFYKVASDPIGDTFFLDLRALVIGTIDNTTSSYMAVMLGNGSFTLISGGDIEIGDVIEFPAGTPLGGVRVAVIDVLATYVSNQTKPDNLLVRVIDGSIPSTFSFTSKYSINICDRNSLYVNEQGLVATLGGSTTGYMFSWLSSAQHGRLEYDLGGNQEDIEVYVAGEVPQFAYPLDEGLSGSSSSGIKVYKNAATPVWTIQDGYPSCCAFFQQRLWMGGQPSAPYSVFASQVADYFNFDIGSGKPEEGLVFDAIDDDTSEVVFLHSGRRLSIHTKTTEFYIGQTEGEPITQETSTCLRSTHTGSSSSFKPISVDGVEVFSNPTGTSLKNMVYTDLEKSFSSVDVSILAGHLLDGGAVRGAVQRSSLGAELGYAFIANASGDCVALLSVKDLSINAMSRFTSLGGKFKDVVSVAGAVYFLVERGSLYTLEKYTASTGAVLDCQNVQGPSVSSLQLDANLTANRASVVFIAPDPLGGYKRLDIPGGDGSVSASGLVTFTVAQSNVTYGIEVVAEIETLPIDIMLSAIDSVTAKKRRPVSMVLDLRNVNSISVETGRSRSEYRGLKTGWKKVNMLGGISRDAGIVIRLPSSNIPMITDNEEINSLIIDVTA